ncbi:MAG TPA: carboxymuconolactone decarboxylase family protein [Methanothrix sp.]|nr:carboxymuconolactone decarboxylase family protein [Methanothrix sp.]
MKDDQKTTEDFTEALGEEVDHAFRNLAFTIMKEGALSTKEKALIALACSAAIRCERCVQRHKEMARKAGASQEEMLEAAAIAGLVRMGSGFNAATVLLDDED